MSKLKQKYIEILINRDNMKVYQSVFTHMSVDELQNYEFYEILGDVTLNKAIVWYLKDRFPKLQNAAGVKIIARLRINLVSKKHFGYLAEKLGFLEFIRADADIKSQKQTSLLEDVFEAFFGATEFLLDTILGNGSGYGICFRIVKAILDQEFISLRYEDLYDPITRLKETFDYYRSNGNCPYIWGIMKFENHRDDNNQQHITLLQIDPYKQCSRRILVTKTCPSLDDGRQAVCIEYLNFLEQQGFKKPISDYYISLVQ
jgi:dsRNA-specific ribonuclease